MRKTKVICTIGPACEDEQTLRKMCLKGMNIARLNFSHGTQEQHKVKMDLVKKVRQELNLPIAIMLDTKGPEYRIKTFANGKIHLEDGESFTFTTEDVEGDESCVSVNYEHLIDNLDIGDRILVNNGLVIFEVEDLTDTDAICKVIVGGDLSDRKSMNFPNKVMSHAYLSEQDKSDLLFGIYQGVDFVAASFVSNERDVRDVREFLDENGGSDIEIIAKIENRAGVNNLEDICKVADGIMVARGDLGVEIPPTEVPSIQKMIINRCRTMGVRVITATEMLESMITNPRPTRAEISDVANAVYDGTSAVMLSGETASGKYPVQAVKTMVDTVEYTEKQINYSEVFSNFHFMIRNNLDAISHSTVAMAIDVNAKCIVVNSLSGRTARMVARFRCPVDIIGMTTSQKVWRKLNLSWGVTPILCDTYENTEQMFMNDTREARRLLNLKCGDNLVVTFGKINGTNGNTNMIKVETLD